MGGNAVRDSCGEQASLAAVARANVAETWSAQNKGLCNSSARELARARGRYNLVFGSRPRRVRSTSIGEREQLLGMPFDCTAAEGVSLASRRRIATNAMDVSSTAYVLSVLLCGDVSPRASPFAQSTDARR